MFDIDCGFVSFICEIFRKFANDVRVNALVLNPREKFAGKVLFC